ncbi:hypothetical protein [Streptomyces shenzhenensis]|uniref:hypothetical protein n=1 Tax=Streptomyces shenzhenensis TaxID=943815 RepID=UPI0033DDAACC
MNQLHLPNYRGKDSGWWSHTVVVYNGRVYDAWTGRAGESIAEFKTNWVKHADIDFPF